MRLTRHRDAQPDRGATGGDDASDEKREYLVIVRGSEECRCAPVRHTETRELVLVEYAFSGIRAGSPLFCDRPCVHGSTVREATRGDLARALLDAADLESDAQAVAHLSVWFQDQADAILSCERMRSDEKRFLDGTADLLRGVSAKLEAARTINGGQE